MFSEAPEHRGFQVAKMVLGAECSQVCRLLLFGAFRKVI